MRLELIGGGVVFGRVEVVCVVFLPLILGFAFLLPHFH
jgi:hypothetical protein